MLTAVLPLLVCVADTPVAVAELRAQDVDNPAAPYSLGVAPAIGERVYCDGRASYDPADPDDRALLTAFSWSFGALPDGVAAADFHVQGEATPLFSFVASVAGAYEVCLRVTNADSMESEADCVNVAVEDAPDGQPSDETDAGGCNAGSSSLPVVLAILAVVSTRRRASRTEK